LSLADLAAVLVTTDVILYFLHDDNDFDGNNNYEAKNERSHHIKEWSQLVRTAVEHHYMDAAAVDRLIEKSALPILNDLLSSWSDKNGQKSGRLNLISRRQVDAVGTLVRHVLDLLPDPGKSAVRGRMLDMVRQFAIDALDNVAVPIATQAPPGLSSSLSSPSSSSLSPSYMADPQRARCIYDASFGQLRRMLKVVTNLVTLWGPFLKTDTAFATAILDFVANRFLFVLSSSMMVDNAGHDENDRRLDDFATIYQRLRDTTDWLNDPALMVAAAPIAGAALAYRVG
jgi:hypothetical protein